MHSDREKPVERPGKQLWHNIADAARALLNRPAELRGPFKTDEATLRKIAALPPSTSAAPEPVEDEPVAWQHRWRVARPTAVWTEWLQGRLGDLEKRQVAAGYINAEERPLYTRPAGERPAVAVTLGGKAIRGAQIATETQGLLRDPLQNYVTIEDAFAALSALSNPSQPAERAVEALKRVDAGLWSHKDAIRALTAEPQAVPEGMVLVPTGIELRADEWLGELIYRALYEHEGGKWAAVEPRYVWYNAGARFRAMLAASPAVQGGDHGE